MRTYGETKNCGGCRFWSEMIAQAIGGGPVQALCLAASGPHASKYTTERETCDSWKSGHHGAVDDPPNYGEETRALYAEERETEPAALGPCCICETTKCVTTIVMLAKRAPIPGHGWGCIECGAPPDGAVAVLCEPCTNLWDGNDATLRFACRGYPANEGRVPIAELPEGVFDHDPAGHPEERVH